MSDVKDLMSRMDQALSAVKDKAKSQQQEQLQDYQVRQEKLKEFEKAQAKVIEIAKPRLEALSKRAGDRVKVTPSVSQTRRAATFDFKSSKALMVMTFSVSPDRDVERIVVEQDLKVVPVLWKFESHSEFSSPIGKLDESSLAKWLDDRIMAFVELFIEIHEGELYTSGESVEDPIAKVSFPKFAAGATVDHGGKTIYFIDEKSKAEYVKQNRLA
jgi:hypothetical protein